MCTPRPPWGLGQGAWSMPDLHTVFFAALLRVSCCGEARTTPAGHHGLELPMEKGLVMRADSVHGKLGPTEPL